MNDLALRLDFVVPPAALLDHAAQRLHSLTDAANGLWFDAASLIMTQGAAWPARNRPDISALPLFPDEMGPDMIGAASGRTALQLTARQNTGFQLLDAVLPGSDWTAGILWHTPPPSEETRTLLTIRGGRGKNYVFLAENTSGQIELRDETGTVSVNLNRIRSGWQMTLISCSQGRLHLMDPLSMACREAPGTIDISAVTNLLIGCRSPRKGMPRSLGAARISAVWLWPGTIADHEFTNALVDYWFWEVA
ncbi:MAG: hypothetical protein ACK5II_02180 [Paracoccus sp. (in: a-proteobacteria)]